MCGIFGYSGLRFTVDNADMLTSLVVANLERGRDGLGVTVSQGGEFSSFRVLNPTENHAKLMHDLRAFLSCFVADSPTTVIGNTRAEPTTEYVKEKDVENHTQPFIHNNIAVAHNGTIANDKDIALDMGLKDGVLPSGIDSQCLAYLGDSLGICQPVKVEQASARFYSQVVGSYAAAFSNKQAPGYLTLLTNYKPIYFSKKEKELFFSSLPVADVRRCMSQYRYAFFKWGSVMEEGMFPVKRNNKALVVCSGGLDSVVAAAWCKDNFYDITLLHFDYGCRAGYQEVQSITAIADYFGCESVVVKTPLFTDVIKGSPLTDPTQSDIAKGKQGAEFAFEWVPARNLIFLSLATAIAEARGFSYIALGNNLEEAGSYPDNEPEFTDRFNHLLPYATGANKLIDLLTPVGNLMKHEIVALGHKHKAPMHLTWSCYHNAQHHCGNCGPCFMRKTAFQINGLVDPIKYEV